MTRFRRHPLGILAGMLLVTVVAVLAWPRESTSYPVEIPVRVFREMNLPVADYPEGDDCNMYDGFFTVKNERGEAVGAMIVSDMGVLQTASDGRRYCSIEEEVFVTEADWYVVEFSNGVRYVVTRDELGGGYQAPWVDLSRTAQPMPSAVATPIAATGSASPVASQLWEI